MKNFFFKLKAIKLKSKAIYYVYHLSLSFLISFLVSAFIRDDKERLLLIVISMIVTVIILSLFGGYKAEKEAFEKSPKTH